MRDGERIETPIIANEIVPVQFDDCEPMHYGGWVDSIHMFSESRLAHVKYWDESGAVSFQFLSQDILAQLADRGIPVVPRTHIYQREVEAHKDHCWNLAEALGQIPTGASVEIEEVTLTDAEIDYFLKEWE